LILLTYKTKVGINKKMDTTELSQDRIDILNKIAEYEKLGGDYFAMDVEADPPAKVLLPNKVDYLNKKLHNRIATWFSNKLAIRFFDKEIKKGNLIIDNIVGFENYEKVKNEGVVITCNHFNAYDNYIVFKALQKSLGKKHLYKVIREGNYTNFPGFYGFLFRHSNTLPLSSNTETMRKFMTAFNQLLKRGEKILIYPEQAMWWNYKKPRPYKNGAFKLASLSKAPILPCFITMEDSDKKAPDGSFYQRHTLHFMPPIYPDPDKNVKENTAMLMEKNYNLCKDKYEEVYKIKLTY